jgi:hypothetical protein
VVWLLLATDDAIAEAGNAQLLRQAVAWLAESEDLLAISPDLADRPLRLTDARLAYARLVPVVGVPALFLLAGTRCGRCAALASGVLKKSL